MMYGALGLPMIWSYARFSMTTTTTWSGVGTCPALCPVPVAPVHGAATAAAAPRV